MEFRVGSSELVSACCSYDELMNFLLSLRRASSSGPWFRTTPCSLADVDQYNECRRIRLRPCFPKAGRLCSSCQGKEQNRHCELLGARCGSAAAGPFQVGLGLQAIDGEQANCPTSFKITWHVNGSLTEGNTKGSEAGNLEGRIKGSTGRALFVGSLQLVLILLPRPLLSAVQLRMFSCLHLSRRLRTQQVSFGYNRNAFRASCNLDFLGMPKNTASFVEGRRNWGGMLS